MKQVVTLTVVGVCVALAVLTVPVAAKNPAHFDDPAQMGPYAIGFTSFLLVDSSRNVDTGGRPIPVFVWYPVDPADVDGSTPEAVYPLDPVSGMVPVSYSSDWEPYGMDPAFQEPPVSAEGPFPLVVFSPGWGAPAICHIAVGTRLASHGFVVAVAYHWGDAWWPWEPFDHIAVAAMNRPWDVSFMLTALLDMNATAGDLMCGAINPEQVAASGWSLGGYAAMALAGGDDSVCDKSFELGFTDTPLETCVPILPDPRIKVIVPLDGSTQFLYFDELSRITLPCMGIGEEWSTLMAIFGPGMASWQARLHAASMGQPGYRVDLADANHQTFSNACEFVMVLYDMGIIDEAYRDSLLAAMCDVPISRETANTLITSYMVAFLKENLAGESGYQFMLTPGYALQEPYIEFFVTEKRNPHAIDEDWPGFFVYFMHQPGSEQAQAAKELPAAMAVPHLGLWW
jgi:predicted dienelactone hydrolase